VPLAPPDVSPSTRAGTGTQPDANDEHLGLTVDVVPVKASATGDRNDAWTGTDRHGPVS